MFFYLCSLAMVLALVRLVRLQVPMLRTILRLLRSGPNPSADVIHQATAQVRMLWKAMGMLAAFEMLPACLIGLPMGLKMDNSIPVVLCLIGAVTLLIVAAVHGVRGRHGNPGFWFVGWLLALTVIGGTITLASIKHLTFFAGADDSAVVYPQMSNSFKKLVKDMHCDSVLLLVRWDSLDVPMTYRCPTGVFFNILSSRPFIPWPDYVEGTSADLAVAMQRTVNMTK